MALAVEIRINSRVSGIGQTAAVRPKVPLTSTTSGAAGVGVETLLALEIILMTTSVMSASTQGSACSSCCASVHATMRLALTVEVGIDTRIGGIGHAAAVRAEVAFAGTRGVTSAAGVTKTAGVTSVLTVLVMVMMAMMVRSRGVIEGIGVTSVLTLLMMVMMMLSTSSHSGACGGSCASVHTTVRLALTVTVRVDTRV